MEVAAQCGGFQGKSLKTLERGIRGVDVSNYICSDSPGMQYNSIRKSVLWRTL